MHWDPHRGGDEARRELRACGERSRRRVVETRDQLTGQERQIAQLAANGPSNREIGQRLYLSHRAISTHLYRVFPKLGISSAAESVPDGAVWLQTSMDTDVERVAGLAEEHGIMFVDCPVIGTWETAQQGRLVVLASGPGDALDRAQPIFDAIGSKTVRLEPDAGRASRMKLVVNAWTVGLWGRASAAS